MKKILFILVVFVGINYADSLVPPIILQEEESNSPVNAICPKCGKEAFWIQSKNREGEIIWYLYCFYCGYKLRIVK